MRNRGPEYNLKGVEASLLEDRVHLPLARLGRESTEIVTLQGKSKPGGDMDESPSSIHCRA